MKSLDPFFIVDPLFIDTLRQHHEKYCEAQYQGREILYHDFDNWPDICRNDLSSEHRPASLSYDRNSHLVVCRHDPFHLYSYIVI